MVLAMHVDVLQNQLSFAELVLITSLIWGGEGGDDGLACGLALHVSDRTSVMMIVVPTAVFDRVQIELVGRSGAAAAFLPEKNEQVPCWVQALGHPLFHVSMAFLSPSQFPFPFLPVSFEIGD